MPVLRINERDPATAGELTGWPAEGVQADVAVPWPSGVRLYEARVVNQPGEAADPRAWDRLAVLIVQLLQRLSTSNDQCVLRVDGPVKPVGEVLSLCTDFPLAMSAVRKFELADLPTISLRVAIELNDLPAVLEHVEVGCRVRLFTLPADYVSPLLDIDESDDERWPVIFDVATLCIETTNDGDAILLHTRTNADELTDALRS